MTDNAFNSPTAFLVRTTTELPLVDELNHYESWWRDTGSHISSSVDQAGTPKLRNFNRFGERIDQIQMDSGYRDMLAKGYEAGVVWRVFSQNDLLPFYQLGYVTAFFDPGVYCPYTVSMATAQAIHKYGSTDMQQQFMPALLKRDDTFAQGATWMTEIDGGSDLGANVKTMASRQSDGHWHLNGQKYFASNVGAELALVAARPEGRPDGVRGLALFLVPRYKSDGSLNYEISRLKDKIGTRSVPTGEVMLRDAEGWLLGEPKDGIYLIMEMLNLSRAANAIASVALSQRSIAEAASFASRRQAFGKRIIEHPLMRQQFRQRLTTLHLASGLAWETVDLLNSFWHLKPPYSDRYLLFRLLAHLAKYWTAEFAVQTSKWAMEVHGSAGAIAEYPVERCFREAIILSIWEGTSHRQMLDALTLMREKQAHEQLFDHVAHLVPAESLIAIREKLDNVLHMPVAMQEERIEPLFRELALFMARAFENRRNTQ